MFLTLFYFLLIGYYLFRWGKQHWLVTNNWLLPLLFLGKCGFALFFLFVYTYHYGGGELTADAARFFEESKVFHALSQSQPEMYVQFLFGLENTPEIVDQFMPELSHWNATSRSLPNDSRNVIRLNSLLFFISNGQILVHFLFFSFISFLASLDFAKFLRHHSNAPYWMLLTALTLFPSVAFWTSSIIKEPLMIVGLLLLIRGVLDMQLNWKWRVMRVGIGLTCMLLFKPYVLFVLLPFLGYYLVSSALKTNIQHALAVIAFVVFGILALRTSGKSDQFVHLISRQQQDFMNVRDGGLYLKKDQHYYYYVYFENRNNFEVRGNQARLIQEMGCYIAHKSDHNDRYLHRLTEIGEDFEIEVRMSKAGSGIDVTRINNSGWTMLRIIPEVLVNVVVRPWPWDNGSWLKYLAFLENVALIVMLVLSLLFGRIVSSNERRWLWSFMLFALCLMVVVGWTTPVLGAIVRYKIPATLAVVIFILVKLDFVRLQQKLSRLNYSGLKILGSTRTALK